jgi:hypothetical protein
MDLDADMIPTSPSADSSPSSSDLDTEVTVTLVHVLGSSWLVNRIALVFLESSLA